MSSAGEIVLKVLMERPLVIRRKPDLIALSCPLGIVLPGAQKGKRKSLIQVPSAKKKNQPSAAFFLHNIFLQ